MIWQRVNGELLLLSAAAVSFRTFTEYYSALWSRFAGVLVGGGGGFGEPYCICNARVWGRDESDSFHILLGWWDLVATQTVQYTLCQKPGTRHRMFLLVLFMTTSLQIVYATGFADLALNPLAILNAYACLLLLVLDHLLLLSWSKFIFFCEGLSSLLFIQWVTKSWIYLVLISQFP